MSYPVKIYADAVGNTYGAEHTDQRGTSTTLLTVRGRPVEYAGEWQSGQMDDRPFKLAVLAAAKRAANRQPVARQARITGVYDQACLDWVGDEACTD